MAEWKSDAELDDVARRVVDKLYDMIDKANAWPPAPGYGPDSRRGPWINVREGFKMGMAGHHDTFKSLDPQKVKDEYARIQRAAFDVSEDGLGIADLQTAHSRLAVKWTGEAANAFTRQMIFIETFMRQQRDRALLAVQAMGISYQLAVTFRRSYHELAEATIAACDKEMEINNGRDAKAVVGMGAELVKEGFSLFSAEGIGDLAQKGIETFATLGSQAVSISLEGSEALAVKANFDRALTQLNDSFEEGLIQLRNWLDRQNAALSGDKVPLLEPLKSHTDVDSPDFRYENFGHASHDPSTYGPKVEEQRKKLVEEKPKPPGPISKRLDGPQ